MERTRNERDSLVKKARFVGWSVVVYSYLTYATLILLLCLTIWLNIIYLTAISLGDATDNFMDGIRPHVAFEIFRMDGARVVDEGHYDIGMISQAVKVAYLLEICFFLATTLQLVGGNCLIKATKNGDGSPFHQSYELASRHQLIQYVMIFSETFWLFLYLANYYLTEWDDPYRLYYGVAVMTLILLIRVVFVVIVRGFTEEVWKKAVEEYGGLVHPRSALSMFW